MFAIEDAPNRAPDLEVIYRPSDSRPIVAQMFFGSNGRYQVFFSNGTAEDGIELQLQLFKLSPVVESMVRVRTLHEANVKFEQENQKDTNLPK